MSSDSTECSKLCRLIDHFLRPFTEEEDIVLKSKEKEKDILVALSQAIAEIRLRVENLDYNSDTSTEAELNSCKPETCGTGANSPGHNCMINTVAKLVSFLTIESQYIQHLAGNVLVSISQFVALSGSNWFDLVHSLCLCLELVMTKILSSSSSSITKAEEFGPYLRACYDILEPRLKNLTVSASACIIRVLRNILKSLKQEEANANLVVAYFDSIHSCFSRVPWSLFDMILVVQNDDSGKIFLGAFVQFLSSLVGQSDFQELEGSSLHNHSLIKIVNIVPYLLKWCLNKQGDWVDMRLSHYFRHKLLVLMIRLSSQIHLECSVLVLWLQLLQKYYHNLLSSPTTQPDSSPDDCLQDSPFLLCISDDRLDSHSLGSGHLQRLASFLFLKCSFSLISLGKYKETPSVHPALGPCSNHDSCREKGLLELHKWLQEHLHTDSFVDHEMYTENCINFASSFLQLYIHEDDLLFKVLLELLNVPIPKQPLRFHKEGPDHFLKEDILLHVSNLFNPVNMFHLFLAELHYDHEVLLDYLISKDAGIYCLEYIVRSLRLVTDSWNLFVEYAVDRNVGNQSSSYKRRKVSSNSSSIMSEHKNRNNHNRTRRESFKQARECLLSLKESMENLHKNNLFSYNPEALLRRLTRFLDLCIEQEK